MSQGTSCKVADHKKHWSVIQRKCNASAFNGYQITPSDYSAVLCPLCPTIWRTKAAFVDSLPAAPADWHNRMANVEREPGTGETPGFLEDVHAKADRKAHQTPREEFKPAFLVPGMKPEDWR